MKYLKEIDVVASNLFPDRDGFHRETASVLYALTERLRKRAKSKFAKIAIKLWPADTSEVSETEYNEDRISNVFLIEEKYDLDIYYSFETFEDRCRELFRLISKFIPILESKAGLDGSLLVEALASVEASNFEYHENIGKIVKSPNKMKSAQLFVDFTSRSICMGVEITDDEKGSTKKVFAEYAPFLVGHLEEIGTIAFQNDLKLLYQPRKHFPAIEIDLD